MSGALFALRSLAVQRRRELGHVQRRCASLSYTIDTVLLSAALMLATIVHQYPFVHGWLTVKVGRCLSCTSSWAASR